MTTDGGSGTGRGRARPRGKASPDAAAQTASLEATAAVAETTPAPDALDPRLAALGFAPAAAAEPSPVRAGGWGAAPSPEPEPELQREPAPAPTPAHMNMSMPTPVAAPAPVAWPVPAAHSFVVPSDESPEEEAPLESVVEAPARVAGGYLPPAEEHRASPWTLRPSSTGSTGRAIGSSLSGSLGAVPVSSPEDGAETETDISAQRSVFAGSSQFGTPAEMPADAIGAPPAPFAAPAAPFAALAAPAATPAPAPFLASNVRPSEAATATTAAPAATAAPVAATAATARKESLQELIAFGLVAGGAVIGMASMLLPWGNGIDGAGIGINAVHSRPNEWGWSMPISIPLFLLSGLVLGAASGSDRAKERLPKLAPVIGQVTDMIIPMILGGLYLGVVLMAATYPWGFGGGVLAMLLAAGLLIGGAVVTLFSPAEVASDAE